MKADLRRSEDSQAWRSSGRRVSDETRASLGDVARSRALGVFSQVVSPLGCRSEWARGWEWGPLEGQWAPSGAVPAPGPRGSALSPTQTHTIRPRRETIRFPACCALPCAVCLCVCARVEAGRAHASGCTWEPPGLALGGSLHQAEKQVKSPRGDWWEWCASHGPRWGVFGAHAAAACLVLALRGCCRGRCLWVD